MAFLHLASFFAIAAKHIFGVKYFPKHSVFLVPNLISIFKLILPIAVFDQQQKIDWLIAKRQWLGADSHVSSHNVNAIKVAPPKCNTIMQKDWLVENAISLHEFYFSRFELEITRIWWPAISSAQCIPVHYETQKCDWTTAGYSGYPFIFNVMHKCTIHAINTTSKRKSVTNAARQTIFSFYMFIGGCFDIIQCTLAKCVYRSQHSAF